MILRLRSSLSCKGVAHCMFCTYSHSAMSQDTDVLQVYLDENEKPEIGEGLNKCAEVTLQKVYRIDKATNRPTTDKDAIARFERKLKKLAADQSARFISYDADTGTWVFEVEHFSK